MAAPSFAYSGNVYTAGVAGTTDFPLVSTIGNAIPYLEASHIHVYKSTDSGDTWTELTRPAEWDFATDGTVARLVTGIALDDWIKVQRITPSTSAYVTFQASSLLTAEQLNSDTLFNVYLNQEGIDQNEQSGAAAALAASAAATDAAAAQAAATAAAADAATASTDAASAAADAATAIATATAAAADAAAVVSTANSASTTAANAEATAANAASDAAIALSTANTASADATSAVTTAYSALASVAASVQYTPVADVAAIPVAPADDTFIEVSDATGIESFSPLIGLPAGFVGDAGLSARLRYSAVGASWNWLNYFANDADARYLLKDGDAMSGPVVFAATQPTATTTAPNIVQLSSSVASSDETTAATPKAAKTAYDAAVAANAAASAASASASAANSAASAAQSTADAALPKAGGTMTGDIAFASTQAYPKVPQVAKTSAYILTAADAGKHVSITTGGITVPASIFSAGDAISIYNNSASSQAISAAGGVTLRLPGTSLTGNRTLLQYGLCTVLCVGSNVFVISGSGLT